MKTQVDSRKLFTPKRGQNSCKGSFAKSLGWIQFETWTAADGTHDILYSAYFLER